MKTLSRRAVLRHLAAGLGLGAFGLAACARRDLSPLGEALVRLVREREAVAAVGRVYLDANVRETPQARLERLAVELDWSDGTTDADLAHRLVARIESDFRDARTVRVDSWILAQTEARWAAVVALA